MNSHLRLEEISETGRQELAVLDGGKALIGRSVNENEGVLLDNQAVSGRHGVFMAIRSHWLFKDLGSTNGSWLNGEKLGKGRWQIVRSGDTLQLANTVIELKVLTKGPQSDFSRSLIVFEDGEYSQEYPVSDYGKALVVGGSNADLPLRGDVADTPSLIIERRGDQICAYSVAKMLPLFRNDEEIRELTPLSDGDEVRIGSYSILFVDPRQGLQRSSPGGEGAGMTAGGRHIRDWGDEGHSGAPGQSVDYPQPEAREESPGQALYGDSDPGGADQSLTQPDYELPRRSPPRSLFGRSSENEESSNGDEDLAETVSMSYTEFENRLKRGDVHPSMRHSMGGPAPGRPMEDKIYLVFFIVLILVLFLILLVWLI